MNLFGITRVRNESAIIADSLDHVAGFCDAVFVYDDASTDGTPAICVAHPVVKMVIRGERWDATPEGRQRAEGQHRQCVYNLALQHGADWVYVFDADEFAEIDRREFTADCYALRLFAFYITMADLTEPYSARRWMGPEFQDIPMIFRAVPRVFRDRVPEPAAPAALAGYVKHYGKAISVEQWEETCDYYVRHRWANVPHLRQRWQERRGRAIHTRSDFGRPLIRWEDRRDPSKITRLSV